MQYNAQAQAIESNMKTKREREREREKKRKRERESIIGRAACFVLDAAARCALRAHL